MGNILNPLKPAQYNMNHKPELFNKLQTLAKKLQLNTKDVKAMFRMFSNIDVDGSGVISMLEFLNFFGLEQTEFNKRTFQLMDTDKSGKIDFVEFVGAIYNYCTFTWQGLCRYAFDLFDDDQSGFLDVPEVIDLVRYVYGKPLDDKVMKILENIDEDMSGTITFKEFCKKNKNYPSLLFPAFHMQEVLRSKCLGPAFWTATTIRRHKGKDQTDEDVIALLQKMEVEAQEAEAKRKKKEAIDNGDAAREEAKANEHGLTPHVVIDAQGHVVKAGATVMDERAREKKMQEQAKRRKHAEEAAAAKANEHMADVDELYDHHAEEEDEEEKARAERSRRSLSLPHPLSLLHLATAPHPHRARARAAQQALANVIWAPKRKPGEKPGIKRGVITYSKAINEKRYPNVRVKPKKNKGPVRAKLVEVKASERKAAVMG